MEEMSQFRQQAAPQAPLRSMGLLVHPRGPRRLCLARGDHGFGFTLRHFLIYPPESYKFSKRDARVNPGEPMETIFVKYVRSGTAAEEAGLATGDRILSVNGENIQGKSYATVVQMIQNTADQLTLVVVPKEDDVIQQCFSETAHHPQTNPRPRLRSPEIRSNSPQIDPVEPIYNSPIWASRSSSRSSTPRRRSDAPEPIITQTATLLSSPGCRLSLDGGRLSSSGGSIRSFDSNSNSTLTDDSQIFSRIRRSCEQKKEFLQAPVKPVYPTLRDEQDMSEKDGEVIAREFYGRPQRMPQPAWPPNSTPTRPLARIREGTLTETPSSRSDFSSNSFDSDPGELHRLTDHPERSRSEEKEPNSRKASNQPQLHLVSHRTKQFESGQLKEDRIHLYRSELSRLSGKRNAPNVAVRKQEFEQRSSQERSLRSPESSPVSPITYSSLPSGISGNRTMIVGSKYLHAAPPLDYRDPRLINGTEERAGSSSSERWSSFNDSQSPRYANTLSPPNDRRSLTETPSEKQRHKAVRQDSYLAAVKTIPGPTAMRAKRVLRRQPSLDSADLKLLVNASEARGIMRPARPSKLILRPASPLILSECASPDEDTQVPVNAVPIVSSPESNTTVTTSVVRRVKTSTLSVDERATRRVSYIKATLSDRIDDTERVPSSSAKSSRKWLYPILPGEIERLRRIFDAGTGLLRIGEETFEEKKENILREGWLHCKLRTIEGKRAADRSWKQLFASLRGPTLSLKKDKRDAESDSLDVRGCDVDVPSDYKKRANVLCLRTPNESEYLLQAEDATVMEQWRTALQSQAEVKDDNKAPARSHSPTGQSPVSKTRKASQPAVVADQLPSPKSKTWKGKLGRPFRRIQSGAPPSSPTYPPGATIEVPLDKCPPSPDNPFVALLVTRCTSIVEALGLDIVGIYRVPGNKAAIAALTDAVNKGIENVPLEDPRWNDVNVISSLLKSFFRHLPDPLFTAQLYSKFIEADKVGDQKLRMLRLRDLINELPDHNYETLKHILNHLRKVVANSEVNKMESKNLAIVFGPTLVRAAEIIALVQDTSHQCRIVESLIVNANWFFSEEGADSLEQSSLPPATDSPHSSESQQNASLLLNNLSKVGGYRGDNSQVKDIPRKDIMSSIIYAANRMSKGGRLKKSDKPENSFGTLPKIKDSSMTAASNIAGAILEGAALTSRAEPGPQQPLSLPTQPPSFRDPATMERIRLFKMETEAALARSSLAGYQHVSDYINGQDGNSARKVGSCESLHDEVKRFKSSREDCFTQKFGSLDSLQAAAHCDEGHDLLITITETFDQKLKFSKVKSMFDRASPSGDSVVKIEIESCDEKECKRDDEDEKDKDSLEGQEKTNGERDEEQETRAVLMPRPWIDNPRVKRSESLNKPERPEVFIKVRRSESLGKADIRRTDLLTKNEKTETNMKAKLKRTSSKEKENNVVAARMKRIKRRHTVGGTKDLDKLPWLDNRVYTEAMERHAAAAATKQTRTSSPDLSNTRSNALISLEDDGMKNLVISQSAGSRPVSMPPPLESHI